jgi:hypothetical protein
MDFGNFYTSVAPVSNSQKPNSGASHDQWTPFDFDDDGVKGQNS